MRIVVASMKCGLAALGLTGATVLAQVPVPARPAAEKSVQIGGAAIEKKLPFDINMNF